MMILEGIVTTINDDESVNISPMGPIVDREMHRLILRPYQTSRTYRNLKWQGQGVFHFVDDVWLLARAAIGPVEPPPETFPAKQVRGSVLTDACRWYEFRVRRLDDTQVVRRRVPRWPGCGPRRPLRDRCAWPRRWL